MRIKLKLLLLVYLGSIMTETANVTKPSAKVKIEMVKVKSPNISPTTTKSKNVMPLKKNEKPAKNDAIYISMGHANLRPAAAANAPLVDHNLILDSSEQPLRYSDAPLYKSGLRTFKPDVAVLYPGFTKFRDTMQECILCQDLLKPILKEKSAIKMCVRKYENLGVMHKIANLLRVNVTDETSPTEIYNVVYQLSRMEFRLFLWPPQSVALMMQALAEQAHYRGLPTWRSIKTAILILFSKYKLDLSKPDVLLKHARIFRPACLTYPYSGSTKINRYVTLTPMSVTKKKCKDTNECNDKW